MSQSKGLAGFIAHVAKHVTQAPAGARGKIAFVLRIGQDYANIQLGDIGRPLRFLKQMAGSPPVQFGRSGFKPELVDDYAPARHYTAFVFVGFWLPYLPAIAVLWFWEVLGFIRYKGEWSAADIRMGYVGIRHGTLLRRSVPAVLPRLIARDLASAGETNTDIDIVA
ncbi:MAG: hypothetical protein KDE47_15985 [Caldilineaceae bacterium]|nr:hypothetical protein [Caldilineaceae bacterium]MCB9156649.1 hypothetical protein [Caldilineaceae bacterium]